MTTSAAKSAFICSLNVVFVALVVGISRQRFEPRALVAATIAIIGVGFLELAGSQQLVVGDFYSLAQPVGFGMAYIVLEGIMADHPKEFTTVTAVKLGVVALSSWAYYFVANGVLPDFTPVLASQTAIMGLLWTGLATTSLSLVLESIAFRYVDATSASVIFTTEPFWATLFAVWLISEPFSMADGIGGVLVVLANIVMVLPDSMVPPQLRQQEAVSE